MSSAIDTAPEMGLARDVKVSHNQGKNVQEVVVGSPAQGGKTPSPESSGGSGLDDSPDTASDPPRTSGAPDAGPEVSELVNQLIVEPERSEGVKRKTRAASKDTTTAWGDAKAWTDTYTNLEESRPAGGESENAAPGAGGRGRGAEAPPGGRQAR